jgi:hypothetical protein
MLDSSSAILVVHLFKFRVTISVRDHKASMNDGTCAE